MRVYHQHHSSSALPLAKTSPLVLLSRSRVEKRIHCTSAPSASLSVRTPSLVSVDGDGGTLRIISPVCSAYTFTFPLFESVEGALVDDEVDGKRGDVAAATRLREVSMSKPRLCVCGLRCWR